MNPFPFVRATLARNPFTATLFVALIAIAVALGIAISAQERALRQGSARAADKFDLIVAAPGSQTDILMASVFLRPSAVELLPGPIAARIFADPDVSFAAPIAFGDSHDGAPVIGTTADFVTHLGSGLAEGRVFDTLTEAVVGALVPTRLGAALEIHHGEADGAVDADSAADGGDHDHVHEDVTVTGRMRPTGTPWDHAIIVPVEYVWNAHAMGTGHAPEEADHEGHDHDHDDHRIGPPWDADHMPGVPAIVVKPDSIAAAYGLRARYRTAETMAFFPAETLVELYEVMGGAARIMSALTMAAQILVVAAILAGLLAVLDLQRRRFAVLRALGAPAGFVFSVVWLYVGAMVLAGVLIGLPLGWGASMLVSDLITRSTGVAMRAVIGGRELAMAGALLACGMLLAVIPAWRIYRLPAAQGLSQ